MRIEWEYKVVDVTITNRWGSKAQIEEIARFEAGLTEHGSQGWELMKFDAVPLTGALSEKIKGYVYLAIFKRPRE